MDIIAGCATTSLYTRRRPTTPPQDGSSPAGEFDCQWHGRADYLPNGVERNWGASPLTLSRMYIAQMLTARMDSYT